MFEDFKNAVLAAYKQKLKDGRLSDNLIEPSPGTIRNECLSVYASRFDPKDEEVFKTFFTSKNRESDYLKNIENVAIDDFRPLINFIKGKTNNPERKTVKLLAWLIDFEPRPYQYGIVDPPTGTTPGVVTTETNPVGVPPISEVENSTTTTAEPPFQEGDDSIEVKEGTVDEEPTAGGDGSIGGNGGTTQTTTEKKHKEPLVNTYWKKYKSAIIAASILIIASVGIYSSLSKQGLQNGIALLPKGNQKCMYWTGDHYQPIDCNQKIGDTPVVGMDEVRLASLKKIMQPDTITKNSIGKIGYNKLSPDQIEFYTCTGIHPSVYNKRLLPLTYYIYNKYLVQKKGFWVTSLF